MKMLGRFFGATTLVAMLGAPAFAQECPMVGDAKSQAVQALNILKNREVAPPEDQVDRAVTLERMMAPGDDTDRFDDQKGAIIEGTVVGVKVGGIETVNCHAKDAAHRDTHIELALTANASPNERVIVEVTPRWREAMASQGIDWSTANLKTMFLGKTVRVEGWLMFDREHVNESENTAPGNPKNWRATVWEIHPISDIQLVR